MISDESGRIKDYKSAGEESELMLAPNAKYLLDVKLRLAKNLEPCQTLLDEQGLLRALKDSSHELFPNGSREFDAMESGLRTV